MSLMSLVAEMLRPKRQQEQDSPDARRHAVILDDESAMVAGTDYRKSIIDRYRPRKGVVRTEHFPEDIPPLGAEVPYRRYRVKWFDEESITIIFIPRVRRWKVTRAVGYTRYDAGIGAMGGLGCLVVCTVQGAAMSLGLFGEQSSMPRRKWSKCFDGDTSWLDTYWVATRTEYGEAMDRYFYYVFYSGGKRDESWERELGALRRDERTRSRVCLPDRY